jgi:peptidoglycan/LPS O-acetylase OafA/YrhL
MIKYKNVNTYRNDIDGLRAIAVLSVITFHFGFLKNGYLGVDVFFVISGYLITGIIYNELNKNSFSITNFYLRRTRRIIPLVLFICIISLAIGIATMLPDDLENLAESVVATNFFSNNILQAITTKNYWDVVNEYKPLMHTWSLGIEEQYYVFYPLLFLLIGKKYHKWLLPLLSALTVASLVLYLSPYSDSDKFYLIPFRFFELSAGGIAAISLKNRIIAHKYSSFLVAILIFILFFDFSFIPNGKILLPITVLLTLSIISSSNTEGKLSSYILENKLMVSIGVISFSLYMWHQVLLSYTRYFVVQKLEIPQLIFISILTVLLSIFTYRFIEQPFRNRNKINTKVLIITLGLVFLTANSSAFYIYNKGGVLKDIPELCIKKDQTERGIHEKYNARIYTYDKNFSNDNKRLKVLVIGDSFARDWVNVLLESKYQDTLDISYIFDPFKHKELTARAKKANIIFYSTAEKTAIKNLGINESKLFVLGTKNFGTSSGVFYNYSGNNYFTQRTAMEDGYFEKNNIMSEVWGERYINYIAKIIDENKMVPVFTPDNKFISQDCRHFTKAGASYFAKLFNTELSTIFNNARKKTDHIAKHFTESTEERR